MSSGVEIEVSDAVFQSYIVSSGLAPTIDSDLSPMVRGIYIPQVPLTTSGLHASQKSDNRRAAPRTHVGIDRANGQTYHGTPPSQHHRAKWTATEGQKAKDRTMSGSTNRG